MIVTETTVSSVRTVARVDQYGCARTMGASRRFGGSSGTPTARFVQAAPVDSCRAGAVKVG